MPMTSSSSSITPPTPQPLPPHLSPDRNIHVILSTLSGRHEAESYYTNTLKPLLTEHSIPHLVHITTSIQSITEFCTSRFIPASIKGVKQTIVLLSGDGGVIDVVNTIASTLMRDSDDTRGASIFVKPVICLFPLGTANALATSANIAADPISVLLMGRPRPLPIFEVRFSKGSRLVSDEGQSRDPATFEDDPEPTIYGAVIFSWGLHASIVATSDTTEYRQHGVERFKMAAQELLKEAHVYRGKVQIQRDRCGEFEPLKYPDYTSNDTEANNSGPQLNDEHVYIIAPLVSTLDPGFLISPSTKTPSETLYLLAIAPTPDPSANADNLMKVLTAAYQKGGHISSEGVVYHPITGLRISMQEPDERWRQVCVDGKIIAVEQDGWVEVRMLPGMGMDGRRVVELVVPILS